MDLRACDRDFVERFDPLAFSRWRPSGELTVQHIALSRLWHLVDVTSAICMLLAKVTTAFEL